MVTHLAARRDHSLFGSHTSPGQPRLKGWPVLPEFVIVFAMPSKQLTDAGSLADWLTAELRKQPRCANCIVHGVYKVPTVHDSNSRPGLVVGQAAIGKKFTDSLAPGVKMAAARFNLT